MPLTRRRAGATASELADGRLIPAAFRAMISNGRPLVRPVTVHEVAIDAGLTNVVHVFTAPVLLEYFTIVDDCRSAGAPKGPPTKRLGFVTSHDCYGYRTTELAGVAGAEFANGRLDPAEFLAITLIT